MKFLFCSSKFQDQQKLIDHYLTYHNIDQNNLFFKKRFVTDNENFFKKCIHCDDFLTTKNEKANHDFIKHYDAGKEIPLKKNHLTLFNYLH